jgi:hypothetical protein
MMNIHATAALWKFLSAHQALLAGAATAIASWAFSAYASTVTEPPPGSPRSTVMWYRFVHMAAANLDKLRGR